jgi:hypothetical protein
MSHRRNTAGSSGPPGGFPPGAGVGGSDPGEGAEWLLLIHQLPAEPAYLRVKVARRLRRLGAVQLKSSVYALPATDEASEDFRWLLREVADGGGWATLVRARFVDGIDDEEVRRMFRHERDGEYDEIVAAARALEAGEPRADEVQRLRRRLDDVVTRDFFDAASRAAAEHAVAAVERRSRQPGEPLAGAPARGVERPHGATWVTRRNAKVDRLASAWLIRRFIDPEAHFAFVDPASHRHTEGELRFDMYEGEYGHEGERCTFETLLARFSLDEEPLRRLGEVVHDLDCKESRFAHPEGVGVAALVHGLAAAHPRDEDRLQAALPLFEALYRSFWATAGAG